MMKEKKQKKVKSVEICGIRLRSFRARVVWQFGWFQAVAFSEGVSRVQELCSENGMTREMRIEISGRRGATTLRWVSGAHNCVRVGFGYNGLNFAVWREYPVHLPATASLMTRENNIVEPLQSKRERGAAILQDIEDEKFSFRCWGFWCIYWLWIDEEEGLHWQKVHSVLGSLD